MHDSCSLEIPVHENKKLISDSSSDVARKKLSLLSTTSCFLQHVFSLKRARIIEMNKEIITVDWTPSRT